MKKFTVLSIVMLLAAWSSVTTAVDMNRMEGDRMWNCMQRYQEMEKATRGKLQPGQTGEIYQWTPGGLRRACELWPPASG